MCGIAGFVGAPRPFVDGVADEVQARLKQRGPDDANQVRSGSVHLIHTRLSIIDTSSLGRQPMSVEADGKKVWICYNGEVYNYRELQAELKSRGVCFKSATDTEVILQSYLKEGIECIHRLNGMFAFVLYDERTQKIWLVRDRLGIKPLYYAILNCGGIAFASELRALQAAGGEFSTEMSPIAVESFLAQGYVPGPHTIVEGAQLLEPGCFVELDTRGVIQNKVRYWDVTSKGASPKISPTDLVELFEDAVKLQLRSDVPLAVFLSSGIDSTSIASLASRGFDGTLETVTVGFPDIPDVDESEKAIAISKELNTKNHCIEIPSTALPGYFEKYLGAIDQPTVDGFNTYFVSMKTAELGFKVALSGLGGDELFAGYATFSDIPALLRWAPYLKLGSCLRPAISLLGRAFRTRSLAKIHEMLSRRPELLPLVLLRREVFLASHRRQILEKPQLGEEGLSLETLKSWAAYEELAPDQVSQISAIELKGFMGNMLLRDSDVFSMAHSLELRVPFLDHRLVEFALSVPGNQKSIPGEIKPFLVKAMGSRLPPSTLTTEKKGFQMPWRQWLLGEFRDTFSDLLETQAIWERLPLNCAGVRDLWRRFQNNDERVSPTQILALFILSRYALGRSE